MAAKHDPDDLARVYGMIENIDDNVGRLLAKLDELKLADNTIVVLFSDNGCQQHNGYNAGFQGWKGTPFEGGIHQFCFVRWPAICRPAARWTALPRTSTWPRRLLDLCGVAKPQQVKFDGLSLAPLLRGQPVAWPDRALFFQWHRGDVPRAVSGLRRAVAGLEARPAAGRRGEMERQDALPALRHGPRPAGIARPGRRSSRSAWRSSRPSTTPGSTRCHRRAGLQRAAADLPRRTAGEPRVADPPGLAGPRRDLGSKEPSAIGK